MSAAPDIAAVRSALLDYYRAEARDLPWRRTRDPYAIWVSEIMLQQTQVQTVKPRYLDFVREFPTVSALAAAGEVKVCEAWAGLGYYRRARHLHAAAVRVIEEHEGALPTSARELQSLPGIGRYTAGAIASICFAEQTPAVDGNAERVLSRLWALPGPISANKKRLWQFASELVVGDAPGILNQALMELGAKICTPRQPLCRSCPVGPWCLAQKEGDPGRYPARDPVRPKQKLRLAFAWLPSPRGLWLARRPLSGLWAGLWEPPSEAGLGAKRRLGERLGTPLGKRLAQIEHTLTHRQVTAIVYAAMGPPPQRAKADLRPYRDPLSAPLSGLARKAIAALWPPEDER